MKETLCTYLRVSEERGLDETLALLLLTQNLCPMPIAQEMRSHLSPNLTAKAIFPGGGRWRPSYVHSHNGKL